MTKLITNLNRKSNGNSQIYFISYTHRYNNNKKDIGNLTYIVTELFIVL